MSNVTTLRPEEPKETVALTFRRDETSDLGRLAHNAASPDMLILALGYLFAAIEQRLDNEPGDEEAECAASYLALAGQELVRGLMARQVT